MAYQVYSTEVLVLKASSSRESDLCLALFARELGFLRAIARSAREERSKMRYHLQDFSYSRVSLIRGKEFWRVTSARLLTNFYDTTFDKEKRNIIVRVISLLKRLLQGEMSNIALFECCTGGFLYMVNHSHDAEALRNIEYVIVLRVLAHLGYIGSHETLDAVAQNNRMDSDILNIVGEFRVDVADHINRAIAQSQL